MPRTTVTRPKEKRAYRSRVEEKTNCSYRIRSPVRSFHTIGTSSGRPDTPRVQTRTDTTLACTAQDLMSCTQLCHLMSKLGRPDAARVQNLYSGHYGQASLYESGGLG